MIKLHKVKSMTVYKGKVGGENYIICCDFILISKSGITLYLYYVGIFKYIQILGYGKKKLKRVELCLVFAVNSTDCGKLPSCH